MKKIWLMIVTAALLLCLTGCVSQSDYDALEEERRLLQEELRDCREENEELQEDLQDAKNALKEKEAEFDRLIEMMTVWQEGEDVPDVPTETQPEPEEAAEEEQPEAPAAPVQTSSQPTSSTPSPESEKPDQPTDTDKSDAADGDKSKDGETTDPDKEPEESDKTGDAAKWISDLLKDAAEKNKKEKNEGDLWKDTASDILNDAKKIS